MVYSLQFVHGTRYYLERPSGEVWHVLGEGTFMLTLDYAGAEAIELWWRDTDDSTISAQICQIPPGSGPRRAMAQISSTSPRSRVAVVSTPRTNSGQLISPMATAGLTIIRYPTGP